MPVRSFKQVGITLALLLFIPLYVFLHAESWSQRDRLRQVQEAGYVVPSQFSRILACGYQGLLSDFQFLRILTFYGSRFANQQQMLEVDWDYFVESIDVVTDLDPHFVDPYVLTEGLLTWEAGRIEEANRLLLKGAQARQNDWRLLYYLGFNHFYFLKNYAQGAEYLMAASVLPGSPKHLQPLAARLAYYGGKSKTALLFLMQMLEETDDAMLRARLETRLLALQGAVSIEEALERHQEQQGRPPETLEELVTAGYLEKMPEEPYGGTWVIQKNGRIFSTSGFANTPRSRPPVKTPRVE